MARILDQNRENRTQHGSARSQETPQDVDRTTPSGSVEPDAPLNDLPDIVDVVMRMERAPEEPAADEDKALRSRSGRSEFGTPNRWLSAGDADHSSPPPLPAVSTPRVPTHLDALANRARDYVEAASSSNTRRAYASDWKHFSAWCRRQGFSLMPPDPQTVGLYITALASGTAAGTATGESKAVSTIERRLSALTWNYAQRGQPLDRGSLRGLRDRAMLLLGFAGGLRRSEVVGLDCGRDQTEDSSGWIEILDKGLLLRLRGKTGWREVEIGRGSSDATCPIVALEIWLKFAKIAHGPLFRRVTGQGKQVSANRLNAQEVARLVKRSALAAGVRGDLPEGQRGMLFAGHSLRAGLASSAEVDERFVQKQLGHSSAEMTRKYQRRRDRFRVNLTKASGL